MRFLFLNQYFPPDPAPTGIQLAELAEHLRSRGHRVDFVSSGQDYRGGKKKGRLWREFKALGCILAGGMLGPRPDVVLSASSPPCLLVAAAVIARRRRARSVHWLMDMYPELAVALGEVKPGPLPRFIQSLMGWGYRNAELLVALDADMAERLKTAYGVGSEIIPPWVSVPMLEAAAKADRAVEEPWTWIYSGNLGRAHEWETILRAQALVERSGAPIRLRFQGGGPSWAPARALAEALALKRCEWKEYVAEGELPRSLLSCHALVVTQRPETQGYLWPSKLALAMNLPRPILFIGPVDGAIARGLRELPGAGIFAPGQAEEVAAWLVAAASKPPAANEPMDGTDKRRAALEKWAGLLEAARIDSRRFGV